MKVSIIIPVYNVEKYVAQCLNSVLEQDYADKEIIIVDDCGTDNSMDVVRSVIAEKEPQCEVHILKHGCNRGVSAARNTGIRAATGDYLFFVDSDDYLMRTYAVSQMITLAQKYPKAELVCGQNHILSENSPENSWDRETYDAKRDIRRKLLKKDRLIVVWNKLIKRNWLLQNGLLFKEGMCFEDIHWMFFAAKRVSQLVCSDTATYCYRNNTDGITGSSLRNATRYKGYFAFIVKDALTHLDNPCLVAQIVYILHIAHLGFMLGRKETPNILVRTFGTAAFIVKALLNGK